MNVIVMEDEVKENLDRHQQRIDTYLNNIGVSAQAVATIYTYDCSVTIGNTDDSVLVVQFKKEEAICVIFESVIVGAIGAYMGQGTAWFNKPIAALMGQSAGFTVELLGALGGTAHVQFSNVENLIGNCTTGGIGIGAGIGTGIGKFRHA
jgi:hypothetical protein